MDLNRDDLSYFLEFVLLDEAWRAPSGKRQVKPMEGMWMVRHGNSGMRESDRRLRCNVCIHTLNEIGGMTVEKAAAHVATLLGRTSAAEVAVIRVAYYERPPGALRSQAFHLQFIDWRAWVFRSNEETLRFFLDEYKRGFGNHRHQRLAKLIQNLRDDRRQRDRNRIWLLEPGQLARTRIESNYWDPERDWQFLATDVWSLGQLHAGIGDVAQAKMMLERALSIWTTHGYKLPHQQADAMAALQEELARLPGT
jgi:hypothetical protein